MILIRLFFSRNKNKFYCFFYTEIISRLLSNSIYIFVEFNTFFMSSVKKTSLPFYYQFHYILIMIMLIKDVILLYLFKRCRRQLVLKVQLIIKYIYLLFIETTV
jgi:hypothetical protein